MECECWKAGCLPVIIPGATELLTVSFSDTEVSALSSFEAHFYDEENTEMFTYTAATHRENIYQITGYPNELYIHIPEEDTLKYHGKKRAKMQCEYTLGDFHEISPVLIMPVGENLELEGSESE